MALLWWIRTFRLDLGMIGPGVLFPELVISRLLREILFGRPGLPGGIAGRWRILGILLVALVGATVAVAVLVSIVFTVSRLASITSCRVRRVRERDGLALVRLPGIAVLAMPVVLRRTCVPVVAALAIVIPLRLVIRCI